MLLLPYLGNINSSLPRGDSARNESTLTETTIVSEIFDLPSAIKLKMEVHGTRTFPGYHLAILQREESPVIWQQSTKAVAIHYFANKPTRECGY